MGVDRKPLRFEPRQQFPYNEAMTASITHNTIATLCQNTAASAIAIEIVEKTGSTNADLLARVAGTPTAGGPIVLIALEQTAGRGRAGRVWHSDASGLTFSLAWPMRRALSGLSGLPLAVGVTIAEVLAAHDIDVVLKWPNDVLLNSNKVAGVLIETVDGSSLLHDDIWVVVGIGINMAGQDKSLELLMTSSDSSRGGAMLPAIDRNALMAALLVCLTDTLRTFEQQGFLVFSTRWNALHAHAGQAVDILDGAQVRLSGYAHGVDATGRLLLQTEGGQVAIVAGDVSLRAASMPQTLSHHASKDSHAAAG